jgi:hypothetical protein
MLLVVVRPMEQATTRPLFIGMLRRMRVITLITVITPMLLMSMMTMVLQGKGDASSQGETDHKIMIGCTRGTRKSASKNFLP